MRVSVGAANHAAAGDVNLAHMLKIQCFDVGEWSRSAIAVIGMEVMQIEQDSAAGDFGNAIEELRFGHVLLNKRCVMDAVLEDDWLSENAHGALDPADHPAQDVVVAGDREGKPEMMIITLGPSHPRETEVLADAIHTISIRETTNLSKVLLV
jgi:hypothetical protein